MLDHPAQARIGCDRPAQRAQPVAAAAAVTAIYRQTKGIAPGGMVMTVIIVVLCAAAAAFGLLLGLPALIAAFAG